MPFSVVIKCRFGFAKVRPKGLAKNKAQLMHEPPRVRTDPQTLDSCDFEFQTILFSRYSTKLNLCRLSLMRLLLGIAKWVLRHYLPKVSGR